MRFKDFDNNWKVYKIDDITKSCGGGTPSTKNELYWNGNIPWISSSDLFDNDIRSININRYITKDALLNSSTKLCPKGTICIVSRVGVGKIAISECEICTSQDFMNIIDFKGNKYFLAQLLQNKIKSSQLQGTSIKGITTKEIKDLRLFIPCMKEQDKIMQFLYIIDEKINTQIKIINKYKSLINQIYDCLLWNFKDTKKIKLSDILIEKNEKSKINDQYPFLSSTVKGLFLQSEYFDREIASSNNIGYKITNKRDIIISPQNLWMGNITYNDKYDNGLVSPSYKIYTINDKYNPTYISTLLKSYRALYMFKTVSEQGASIVRRNLNLDSFYEISFNIPSKKEQDKISKLINSFNIKISLEEKYLQDLQYQKKFLLDNMFI